MPLPAYTLVSAASAISACLSANASANVDRLDRLRLDASDKRLRGGLRVAWNERTPEHYFGANWHGPALASVLRDCEDIRA